MMKATMKIQATTQTRRLRKIFLAATLAAMLPLGAALAQTDPGGGGIGDPDPTEQVPVDGGLSLLLAAGAGLGARKIYLERKRKATSLKNESV